MAIPDLATSFYSLWKPHQEEEWNAVDQEVTSLFHYPIFPMLLVVIILMLVYFREMPGPDVKKEAFIFRK